MAKTKPTKSKPLAELEKLIRADLPIDYCVFMSTFDGKLPEDRSFKLRRDDWRELNALWPLKGRDGSVAGGWGLLTDTEAHLLVIGDDGGGNWICLDVRGPDRGKVFFIDHEHSPGERGRVTRLADSFDAFMRGLKPG
jgi:hypothetical protein